MEEIQILSHSRKKGVICFPEFWTESFQEKPLRFVNGVLFEMLKTALKDTYMGITTSTAIQNEVSTCRKIYYDKETRVMVNQSVNSFYTRFLFKMDTLPQALVFPLYIDAIFLTIWVPTCESSCYEKGTGSPKAAEQKQSPRKSESHFGQKCFCGGRKQNIKNKSAVKSASGSCRTRKFMVTIGEKPLIHMAGLVSIFQYEELLRE